MKTTMQRYRRLLGLSLLTIGLGALNALAGDVTADNITVNHDLTVIEPGTGSAPTNGLVLYYSFSTNATPVPDDSGNSHTGALGGATWVTNGQSTGGYSFDGSTNYITVTGYKGILGNNPVSVSLWFKTSETSPFYPFMYQWGNDAANLGQNALLIYPDNVLHADSANATYNLVGTTTVTDGTWHHAVVTFDGRYKYLYLDNHQEGYVDGVTGVNVQSQNDVVVGDYHDFGSTYAFNGLIDELRIYNRALSSNEVQGLYYNDAHLTAGSARFETDVICEDGVKYIKALGDIPMGIYTNNP